MVRGKRSSRGAELHGKGDKDFGGFWTVEGGFWTVEGGFWTVEGGFWAIEGGFWTFF